MDIAIQLNNKDIRDILDRHTNVFNKSTAKFATSSNGNNSPGKPTPRTRGAKSSGKCIQTISTWSSRCDSQALGDYDNSVCCSESETARTGEGGHDPLFHSVPGASTFRLLRERGAQNSPFTMRKQGSKISLRSMEERKLTTLDDDSAKFKFGRRRGSLSLPDLRDMSGCLVQSGETTPSSSSPFDTDSIDEECSNPRIYPIDRYSKKNLQKDNEPVSLPAVGRGTPCLCSPQVERSLNARNSKKAERLHRNLLLQRTS